MCAPLLLAAIPAIASAAGGAAAAGGLASTVGLATAGIGALSSVASYFGTQSAHHAAVQSANLNYAAKDEQAQRENAQLSAQETESNLTDAVTQAQNFGKIAVSASAMGMGQYSAHQLLSASAAGYNRTLGIKDANYDNKRANLQTELEGASLQRSSAIAAAPKTNLLNLGLDLAGNALQGVSTYAALGGKFGIKPVGAGNGGLSDQAFDWRGNNGDGVIY